LNSYIDIIFAATNIRVSFRCLLVNSARSTWRKCIYAAFWQHTPHYTLHIIIFNNN